MSGNTTREDTTTSCVVSSSQNPLSLYFHIPFCSKKCPYCHFYSVRDDEHLKDTFVHALCCEFDQWKEQLHNRTVVSIYFGGGTPFLFGPDRTQAVLEKVSSLHVSDDCEITLEANPETVTRTCLQEYRSIGINRLSLGAQSFFQEQLQILQRHHTPSTTISVINDSIACGFSNISVDLMYDLPGLCLDVWEQTLNIACALPIQHLSLYNLTIEPKTAWFRKKEELEAKMPHDELSLQMYQAAQQITELHGFTQYEISAFARPGFASRHNSGYWLGREFIGFGPSAFSFFNKKRFSNISNLSSYIDAQETGKSSIDYVDEQMPQKRLREMIAIGLRMNQGIHLDCLEQTWGKSEHELLLTLQYLESVDLLERNGSHYVLTYQGRLVYDSIAIELI